MGPAGAWHRVSPLTPAPRTRARPPSRLISSGAPGRCAGMVPVPTQTMPCCIAKVSRYCKVESLSPLG